MKHLHNVNDFRNLARRRLPRGLFEFVDRGTEDEVCLRGNRAAFEEIKLLPKVLRDVSQRTTETEIFGHRLGAPLIVAPTGVAGLLWYQGEVALAKAAAECAIPFTLATGSLTAIETVASETTGPKWFQLYMWPDKELSFELVERVERANFDALVVTVDVPVPSNREYNLKSGFTVPFRLTPRNIVDVVCHPRWALSVVGRYAMSSGLPRYENMPSAYRTRFTSAPVGRAMPKSDSVSWEDFKALRRKWSGPLVVKGILRPDDAETAVAQGADAVVVSNHGGRMLDSSIAPIRHLQAIVDRVGGRVPVFIDSGFVRGGDVVKALALGASAVLVGRAPLYGVAVNGEKGAQRVLEILIDEIRRVIGLLGCQRIDDLDEDFVVWKHCASRPDIRLAQTAGR